MSAAQERKRNQQGAALLGLPAGRTLRDLLDRRHADLSPTWTAKYAKDRERAKEFWLGALGDVELTAVTAATVERIARENQAGRADRWQQDMLRYVVDSYTYAERKLKWIDARHNLSDVTIPKARGRSVSYTKDEAVKVLAALWRVDERAGWMGIIAIQTGRRIGAIRRLQREDVQGEIIQFAGANDKARRTGQAVVIGLPERTDWRVPRPELVNTWMREAERLAGVEHVEGRGWHGLKRLYATLSQGMPAADLQSGTLSSTLSQHYRQDLLAPKRELAQSLAQLCPPPLRILA